jgi:hypothetical protein
MKYLKKFSDKASYDAYINSTTYFPNVSHIEGLDKISFNPVISSIDYEWVDLGLPSGTKWAAWNVGATKPEEYGLYFAWGETQGYKDVSSRKFTWSEYKYADKTSESETTTKYNSEDGKVLLDLVDDIAYKNNNTCRIPTVDDFLELINNTTIDLSDFSLDKLNGVKGKWFTSKINGNSIFFPATGYCQDGKIGNNQIVGMLWTNKRDGKFSYSMSFNGIERGVNRYIRSKGHTIRPVKP